ncbi:MAG: efflux RND transporter periplasmic adaptor subunit [Pirellulales bacterium]|jgi:HlyD family secretion protein|nr:efflux RND transporter periplasmic adaptor subunit [Thermoguttaceae bacterium]MDD4785591.1 efflux RND transporter periplasmic adaptor subunit [Pirellulales bacterium]MDI9442626.1 efflux RND transporter periplasmic adaptor subunit [Planctomycetota bacterium]NLZ02092.1 HlyD family efflux transporter periplasmic adaptor subunit [Pirellulaceae bacterium]
MNTTKWILAILAGCIIVAAIASALVLRPGEAVEVVCIASGPIEEYIDERAITRLSRTHLVSMPYAARIEEIALREGDAAEKDNPAHPLARIVADDLQLAVDQAQAVVKRLDASIVENLAKALEELAMRQAYEFARSMNDTIKAAQTRVDSGAERKAYFAKRLERIKQAHAAAAVTEDERDLAALDYVTSKFDLAQDELVLKIAKALTVAAEILPEMILQMIADKSLSDAVLKQQRAEAEAALAKARLDERRATILSPVDGVVLKRHVVDEQFLAAGAPLLEVGRLEDLEVEADLLSVDVGRVELGDPVEIYGPAVGPRPARGKVARIYPAGFTKVSSLGVEEQRVKVIVAFDPEDLKRLTAEHGLQVGYRLRVKIITTTRQQALVAPRSSLFRGEHGQWQVFVVERGRARIRQVELGLMNDRQAEVLSGLDDGALVISMPQSSLRDGVKVAPQE